MFVNIIAFGFSFERSFMADSNNKAVSLRGRVSPEPSAETTACSASIISFMALALSSVAVVI